MFLDVAQGGMLLRSHSGTLRRYMREQQKLRDTIHGKEEELISCEKLADDLRRQEARVRVITRIFDSSACSPVSLVGLSSHYWRLSSNLCIASLLLQPLPLSIPAAEDTKTVSG